jgi:phytoene/squalene synthetase
MTIESSLTACEETVRRADPDRYFSALFAPAERRPLLFALYAFNHELAHVAEVVREPMIGEIRLAWWREAVEEARDGRPRAHDVVRALAEVFARSGPPLELLEAMIDARSFDVTPDVFADLGALETYAGATSGSLMRLAASVLLDGEAVGAVAGDAGTAYGLAGILRAIGFHAPRHKLFLPRDILDGAGLSPEDVFAGNAAAKLNAIVSAVAARARTRLAAACARQAPRHALPALMPAALVPLYLKRLMRRGFDPLGDKLDVPLFRKQIAFMGAAAKGRI